MKSRSCAVLLVLAFTLNCFGKKPEFIAEYELSPLFSKLEKKQGKPLTAEEKESLFSESEKVIAKRFRFSGAKNVEIRRNEKGNYVVKATVSSRSKKLAQAIFRPGGIEFRYCDDNLTEKVEALFNRLHTGDPSPLPPEKLVQLTARLAQSVQLPPNREIVFPYQFEKNKNIVNSSKPAVLEREIRLAGKDIESVYVGFDEGRNILNLETTETGKAQFARITSGENRGKTLAIVFDGKILSRPRINESILNGRAAISGDFMASELNEISLLILAGSLPVDLEILGHRVQSAN